MKSATAHTRERSFYAVCWAENLSQVDMLDADFFPLDKLPELSEDRILESQLKQLFHLAKTSPIEVYFD